jgi:hypothetical protein
LIVCIKAEDPIGGDLRLFDCIPPLIPMVFEIALEQTHSGNEERRIWNSIVLIKSTRD